MKRFAVIGSPVAHSKSPEMHAAAYRALGLPHTYEKLETTDAELPARVDALRRGDFAGLNVTVPHKIAVLAHVDEIAESARIVGAANTLVRLESGRVVAHNTDADALAGELARVAAGTDLRGKTGLVLGTGGAARAAIAAFGTLGFARVIVVGRGMADPARATAMTAAAARILAASPGAPSIAARPLESAWSPPPDVGAIVQATSAGMHGGPPGAIVADAIAWPAVAPDAVVIDVVYTPRETPLLARARALGLRCDDGTGMLARQGALAFALWLGVPPPYDAMRAALDG